MADTFVVNNHSVMVHLIQEVWAKSESQKIPTTKARAPRIPEEHLKTLGDNGNLYETARSFSCSAIHGMLISEEILMYWEPK